MRVRATATFAGALAGRVYKVDARDAEVKSKIEKGWFVPLDEPTPPPKPRRRGKR